MSQLNYMEEMFYLHDVDGLVDLPEKIYIEPTSMCNLGCAICFRHGWINEKLGRMSMEDFEKVRCSIKGLLSVKEVFFGGMGEPLFHPEICQMIEKLSDNLSVSLLSSGTLLDKKCSRDLIKAGVSYLWLSMDGFDKESYESIQLGSRFDLIMKNLKDFNEARKGSNVKLGITFVVTPENVKQLNKINAFADSMEVDILNISHMIPGTPVDKDEMLALYAREDIPVGKMRRYEPKADKAEENVCPFVKNRCVFVRWDGDVAPCMQLLHSCKTYLYEEERTITRFSYGNITEKSLWSIWNDEEYQAFRKRVNTFYFPFCRVCFGCGDRKENLMDCFLGEAPTCGACLWASGKVFCP